ncbi:MAG: hypothetical protein AABY22_10490 [Nanoarchaeota archaeon]
MKKRKKNRKLSFNKIKEQEFFHGKYKITWKKPYSCDGICFDPNIKEIKINPNMRNSKQFLKILIDESIHANFWNLDNEIVYDASTSIANFLWDIGWRLKNK